MNYKAFATKIFLAAVEKVKPDQLIRENVRLTGTELQIAGQSFPILSNSKIVVTGAGKASALMAQELENILENRISSGHIVVKHQHAVPLKFIGYTEAGHPVPDANGISGTKMVTQTIGNLTEDDLHICLISGGGSALLTDEPAGGTLAELMQLNELLLKCGAEIGEINAVRKHLSAIKGGQLARLASPATTISLILSDVINDPLDVIASGPTAPDFSTFSDVWAILEKYGITHQLPFSILNHLKSGKKGEIAETPKPGDPIFSKVHNFVIGNNRIALEEADRLAKKNGFNSRIVTHSMDGNCEDAARFIFDQIRQIDSDKATCLLFGGETTVQVTGAGKGGRNQHLALLLSKILSQFSQKRKITVLCAGTDGSDGPTDATGAVVDQDTWSTAMEKGIAIDTFIANNDSYNFFKIFGNHIVTGPTMTNVMDLVIVLVE